MITHGALIERYPSMFPLSLETLARIRGMSPEQMMMKDFAF